MPVKIVGTRDCIHRETVCEKSGFAHRSLFRTLPACRVRDECCTSWGTRSVASCVRPGTSQSKWFCAMCARRTRSAIMLRARSDCSRQRWEMQGFDYIRQLALPKVKTRIKIRDARFAAK